jgi:hypothetical protein
VSTLAPHEPVHRYIEILQTRRVAPDHRDPPGVRLTVGGIVVVVGTIDWTERLPPETGMDAAGLLRALDLV